MIVVVHQPSVPEGDFTEIVCDRCLAPCLASRVPGRGRKRAAEAGRLALAAGWGEAADPGPTPDGPRGGPAAQLVCPDCRAKEQGER